MKLKNRFTLLINFLVLLGLLFSIEIDLMTHSVVVSSESFYSDNPFTGGTNKPRIRWLDWNNDNKTDLFLLDEDGKLKYFQNEGDENYPDFVLNDPSFQNINCGGWFYFGDFDNDNQFELMTQNTENPSHISYYENENGNLFLTVNSLATNLNENVISEAVITPTFADIDDDGDLDFFTGHVTGALGFYENIDFVNGIPIFEFHTNEWQNILIIGQSVFMGRHGASAVNFIDLDGDLDLDLTWGDYFQQSLYIVWNLGTPENPIMDISNITNNYPDSPYTIETAGQNMPSFSDLDNDGDMDLYITVLGGAYGFQTINNFYQFENVGDSEYPLYVENTRNYLNSLDFYDKVCPEFVDLDNDGDDDLIIGNSFETNSFPWNGRLKFLENIGTNLNPEYNIIDEEFLGTLIGKELTPTFVDIDNDGDLDFFSGETYGNILFSENLGDISIWNFDNIINVENIDVGYNSSPVFLDIDNDLDLDMFIGNSDGNIHYFENIGTQENFNFEFITENFFDIQIGSKSTPEFFDYDFDGDFDLLIGSEFNGLFLFKNIGTNSIPNFILNEEISFPVLGTNLKPAINHPKFGLNNIYVGNTLGGLFHLQFSTCGNFDLDANESINIDDILLVVGIILGESSTEEIVCAGDFNLDGFLNIMDIIEVISQILN